jgi:hypothetical protein
MRKFYYAGQLACNFALPLRMYLNVHLRCGSKITAHLAQPSEFL